MTIRLLFVTTGLETGGAEMMLYKLLQGLSRETFVPTVASLGPVGRPAMLLRGLGVDVVELDMHKPGGLLSLPFRLRSLLKRSEPNITQGWMYHGNLVAWMLSRMASPRVRLAWSVRQPLYNVSMEKPLSRAVIRINALLSKSVDHTIYVSDSCRAQHVAAGFRSASGSVIPNGFDLSLLYRDPVKGNELRRRWGVSPDDLVVGHLARFHPVKDHATLIRAAAEVVANRPDVRFALAGPGVDDRNETLQRFIADVHKKRSIMLLGETDDPAGFFSACDVFCLNSLWEGFPNVLGEAMACELPAVVTNVGACPEIIGDCGVVANSGDVRSLSESLLRLLDMDVETRRCMGTRARARVEREYSLPSVVERYSDVYRELVR